MVRRGARGGCPGCGGAPRVRGSSMRRWSVWAGWACAGGHVGGRGGCFTGSRPVCVGAVACRVEVRVVGGGWVRAVRIPQEADSAARPAAAPPRRTLTRTRTRCRSRRRGRRDDRARRGSRRCSASRCRDLRAGVRASNQWDGSHSAPVKAAKGGDTDHVFPEYGTRMRRARLVRCPKEIGCRPRSVSPCPYSHRVRGQPVPGVVGGRSVAAGAGVAAASAGGVRSDERRHAR
jgi:hypothetical protein